MKWYLKVLKNYVTFTGRASRSEFWFYFLFNVIFAIVAMILDNILGTKIQVGGQSLPYGYVYILYALATFVPGLAVSVRRLHDVDKSGWFYFILLIPIIGGIWLLVLFCTEGTRGENKYGLDPLTNMPDFDFDNPKNIS